MIRTRETTRWRDEDLYAIGAQPLRARSFAKRRTSGYRRVPWIRLTLTSAALIALIAIYAGNDREHDSTAPHSLLGAPPELQTPPSPWSDLPFSDLDIVVVDEALAGLPLSQVARAHEDGTLQDIIEIGSFRSTKPHLRVLLERRPEGDAAGSTFFIDLALRAAHAGLAVARSLLEEPLATHNERFEVARVVLENGRSRTCLAFRTVDDMQSMRLNQPGRRIGWLCGNAVTREDLACTLEGIGFRHRETGLWLGGPLTPEAPTSCTRKLLTTEKPFSPHLPALTGPASVPSATLASSAVLPPRPPRRPGTR